jgi:hypothetical protein
MVEYEAIKKMKSGSGKSWLSSEGGVAVEERQGPKFDRGGLVGRWA